MPDDWDVVSETPHAQPAVNLGGGVASPATPAAPRIIVRQKLPPEVLAKKANDLGYGPGGSAGIVQNLIRESGGDPTQVGDSGTSLGLFQHHAERRKQLEDFAKGQGKDATDPDVQFQFADKEMREQYPKLRKMLMDPATTSAQAEEAFRTIFERPKADAWATTSTDKFRWSDYALKQHANRPDTDVVWMKPSDYLDLTPGLGGTPANDKAYKELRASLAKGEAIEEIPSLEVSTGPGGAKVTDQDGRHRALAAQEAGIDLIPVAVKYPAAGKPSGLEAVGMGPTGKPTVTELEGMTGKLLPFDFQPYAAPQKAAEGGAAPEQQDDTETTLSGMAASVGRGLAPYAAGAAVGAGLGTAAGGVGAIPGAVAGAGAVAATDLVSSLWRPIANATGLPQVPSGSDAVHSMMDHLGVRRPHTSMERIAQTAAAGLGGATSGAGMMGTLANRLTNPTAKAVADILSRQPVAQAISGALGGASSQVAVESGAGPLGQEVAGFLGSLLAFPHVAARAAFRINASDAAKTAVRAGYVLPPAEATEGSIGAMSPTNFLAGASAKIKTAQQASAKNQVVTDQLAASELGLPRDTPLTPAAFNAVRAEAGKAYAAIRAVPIQALDAKYVADVDNIGAQARAAAVEFPSLKTPEITAMRKELVGNPSFTTMAMVEKVKRLRHDSIANLQNRVDPDKLVLGLAQRQAALVIEDLMERNLTKTGDAGLLQEYREARAMIAKSYDVESATNASTNHVDARHLGALFDKGRPLTGNLKIIADSANHFPKAFQNAAKIGGVESFSVLDMAFGLTSALAMGAGRPFEALAIGAAPFVRPAVRSGILSHGFQNNMVGAPAPATVPLSALRAPLQQTVAPPQAPP